VTLGLELRDAAATAVLIDADGRVTARAEHVFRGDRAAGAEAAVSQVAPGGDAEIGVAAHWDDAEAVRPARIGRHPVRSVVSSGLAAAVAEAWIGAARGAADVVFFAAADHPIAGFVRGGKPFAGARGQAPAVAWMALNPVEREDYRRVGCLEAEVGASGIVRRLIWRVKSGDRSRVEDLVGGDLSAITVEHVLAAARDGDGVSVSVVRDTARYLGMAAANLIAFADPEVLVLGGLMASADDLLLEPVRAELARRVPAALTAFVRVVPAALGPDAPAIGAARLAAKAAGTPS
jgi:glucokinase